MQVVANLDEAVANVTLLEQVRLREQPGNYAAYLSLIKRGTCFLPYPTSDGLAFAPSRFIGYAGNSFAKHAVNKARDGRETNVALSTVLGRQPVPDAMLDQEYHRFCTALGFEPWRTGTFGAPRKFWITPNIEDRLDAIA